jgi:hypothetical protein
MKRRRNCFTWHWPTSQKVTMPIRDWKEALNQFAIVCEGRMPVEFGSLRCGDQKQRNVWGRNPPTLQ